MDESWQHKRCRRFERTRRREWFERTNPTVYIDNDGYWVINDVKTDYFAGERVTPDNSNTPTEEKLSKADYYGQVVSYGSCNQPLWTNRARISFSLKMKAGTTFTFLGDTSAYQWGIAEVYEQGITETAHHSSRPANSLADSGWIKDTLTYTTKKDCFPMPTISRKDNSALTHDDLMAIQDMFTVDGMKISCLNSDDTGTLSKEEYDAQVVQRGTMTSLVDTSMRLTFAIKLDKGAKVTFKGNTSVYKWEANEVCHSAQNTSYYTSGTNAASVTEYTTLLDGSYLVLVVSRIDGQSLTYDEIASMRNIFEVSGTKWTGQKVIKQTEYAVSSVSHRGYSLQAPENTLSAYKLSALNGFTKVETDVSFTSDGHAVLLHDTTIDRTSNGTGAINQLTLEQVRQYDFGS